MTRSTTKTSTSTQSTGGAFRAQKINRSWQSALGAIWNVVNEEEAFFGCGAELSRKIAIALGFKEEG